MKVLKRDGSIKPYEADKVILAVVKAMMECNFPLKQAESVAEEIEEDVVDLFEEDGEPVDIELIQDVIEEQLMEKLYGRVAKAYILYRAEQEKLRDKKPQYRFLSNDFISKYKHKPNPFPTVMGAMTYTRTYSRFLPEFKRREFWWETVARVVDANCALSNSTSIEEAEKLFDNIYNLRQFPSGRSLWQLGTEVTKSSGMANFNCSFTIIDDFESYRDMFLLLMLGAGVGFRILKEDVSQLPKVRNSVEIVHKYYQSIPKQNRQEHTTMSFTGNIVELVVGDSRWGWADALYDYFKLLYEIQYKKIDTVLINYDNVRPKGEPLKTFGGYASGHESLMAMFEKIHVTIQKSTGSRSGNMVKLKPIDCMDIANIIGENVVSGGVRRTSEVTLFGQDDKEVLNSKTGLYDNVDGEWKINPDLIHRAMSNNSIIYTSRPTKDQIKWQIETMRYSGEPGFCNLEAMKKRNPDAEGGNPCMEIILRKNGMCNLTEINLVAFVEDGKLNLEGALEAQKLSARMGYRMALVDFELPKWDTVNKQDMLIGCSITGWQDAMNLLKYTTQQKRELLQALRDTAVNSANALADELGRNRPKLTTTVKPSGTISILPSVSSGIHYSHSEFYTRRVRVNAHDPIVKVIKELDYPIYPENGQTMDNCTTIVTEFPMKSPKGKTKNDVTAIEQLEEYKLFMEDYCQHNVSITVTVKENEWERVIDWMDENWDSVVAVSFLPHSDSMYKLLPYEEISEKEYNERIAVLKPFNSSLLSKYETHDEEYEVTDDECVGGHCPIK